jgi:branched-chain amino acid aminotransferase
MQVAQKGYSQILWLLGDDHKITEVGTMNLFVFLKDKSGKLQLFTPSLDGTILPGVTRKSILEITRAWNEFDVVEGHMSMAELIAAINEGRVLEMFGAGTAVVVSPIKKLHYTGTDYTIPLDPSDPAKESGPLALRLWETLIDIQYGRSAHPWSHIVNN